MATILSAAGCDSTFNVVLTFQDAVQGPDFTNTDCRGSGFEVTFGSDTFDEANPSGMATIPSAAGCDSTFNVMLTFQDVVQGPDFANTDCTGSGFEVAFGSDNFNEANPSGMATIPSAAGCDSTFNVALLFRENSEGEITGSYCIGDDTSFTVGTEVFNETNPTGMVNLENQNTEGCDSLVTINLIFEEITLELIGDGLICKDEDATITILTNTNEAFDITIINSINEQTTYTGVQNGFEFQVSPSSSTSYSVANVSGIVCAINFINSALTIEVSELEVELIPSDYNGFSVACAEDENGSIEAFVEGANGNIEYVWSDGSQTSQIANLPAGEYNVQVSDELGCMKLQSISLLAPEALELDYIINQAGCDGMAGGITILDISGGSMDLYSINIDDELNPLASPSLPLSFTLDAGPHVIDITDENGCIYQETFQIENIEADDLFISITESQTIELGNSLPINIAGNFDLDSIVWTPSLGLSCGDCVDPVARPLVTTNYVVEAFDAQGCSSIANILVVISQGSSYYIPNAFTPNGDGINDLFYIFGGDDVAIIQQFAIFDRWGNQVFFIEDFPPNNARFAWNGNYRERKLKPGVFVYYAQIELIDGFVIEVEGDVTLLK